MLLLMRRVGETIRINESVTIKVIQINKDSVNFMVEGLSSDKDTGDPLKSAITKELKIET